MIEEDDGCENDAGLHFSWLLAVIIIFGTITLLGGCSGWKPYAVVGIGYKLPPTSQELLDDGSNPTARLEAGYENSEGMQVGWCHNSHWRDGWPFNDKPEFQLDEVCVKKTFGGY